MSQSYRRIVLDDDSSDISMISLANNTSSNRLLPSSESHSHISVMEQSIRDVSEAMQNMSVMEEMDKTKYSESIIAEQSAQFERFDDDDAENSYLEDSFLVKDSDDDDDEEIEREHNGKEEGSAQSSILFDADDQHHRTTPSQHHSRPLRYAESTPLHRPLKNMARQEQQQHSILETIEDEESRLLLLELYPELKTSSSSAASTSHHPYSHHPHSQQSSSISQKSKSSTNGQQEEEESAGAAATASSSGSSNIPMNDSFRIKSNSESSTSDEEDDEDDFERFIRETKATLSTKKSRQWERERRIGGATDDDDDLKDFIVDDDDEISDGSVIELSDDDDDDDANGDDADKENHPVTSTGPVHYHRLPVKDSPDNPSPNAREKPNVLIEYIPTTERTRKVHGRIKVFKDDDSQIESILRPTNTSRANRKEKKIDDDEQFLMALSPNGPMHRDAEIFIIKSKFNKIRDDLTKKLFDLFNKRCFEEKLDGVMKIEWNTRLRLTAGRCRCMRSGSAIIELSTKVCNTAERVRDTLIHEMCHAAVWVIDHISNGQHGPAWKYWAMRCMMVFNSLPAIERCHNYDIDTKFLYVCSRCGQTLKRHTKSFNTARKVCGVCGGHFELKRSDGRAIQTTKRITKFAAFVKYNYGKVKRSDMKHAEVMRILAQQFKNTQLAKEQVVETTAHDEVQIID